MPMANAPWAMSMPEATPDAARAMGVTHAMVDSMPNGDASDEWRDAKLPWMRIGCCGRDQNGHSSKQVNGVFLHSDLQVRRVFAYGEETSEGGLTSCCQATSANCQVATAIVSSE